MNDTSELTIDNLLLAQRDFFAGHNTRSIPFRLESLHKLKAAIIKHENKILNALWHDLHKSPEEAYLTEISIVLQEIGNHIRHLNKWAKPLRVPTPFHLLPSSGKVICEPLGVTLIVAPWNYPFQLLINALVGSISAGNCTILKPSPYAANTALVMEELIEDTFQPEYISIVQGGRNTNEILFSKRFDMIFYTGSPSVGKVVMRAAADNLIPVVLELGGKSPCIVDRDADIDIAAKRIAWGKTLNAGQTCIAPDYVFAHRSVKELLIRKIIGNIEEMYGEDTQKSRFYPRIINSKAFERLTGYLKDGNIVYGGITDKSDLYISPTVITGIDTGYAIMRDEIFGPILPVIDFDQIDEAINFVNSNEKPLALYFFGKSRMAKEVLLKTTSGGACVNDTLMHVTNHHLPFGGVGASGMGKYHGKDSFMSFSNRKSILTSPAHFDMPFRYVPFRYNRFIRRII